MTARSVLLVDAGNTRIKWCLIREGKKESGAPIECSESLADALDRCWSPLEVPGQCALACVSGAKVEREISAWLAANWSLTPYVAHSSAFESGVESGYRQPERLGVDRWLALIGAARRSSGPLMVVDLGTAVSVDLLDAGRRHRGGYLLPGRRLMCAALVRGTAGVEVDEERWSMALEPGSSTEDALSAGITLALSAALERIHDQAGLFLGEIPRLMLTGGDAVWMQARLACPCEVQEDLLFEGLWAQWMDRTRSFEWPALKLDRARIEPSVGGDSC